MEHKEKTENTTTYPLLSIIVPIYNIMDCLPRCVRSICHQTYENLEIILVDDGSTDGTGALCDQLAKEDDRIKVLHKENGGSSSARNMGIEASKGAYIGFVDSDDYIEPEMYETLFQQIQKTGMQIAQVARHEIAEDGTELPPVCFAANTDYAYSAEEFLRELLMHRGDCSFCTKLIDRALFQEHRFPIGVLNEDFNLLVHMLQHTSGVASSPRQMYDVYYRTGSNTRKKSKEDFSRVYVDCVDNAHMVYDLVQENYPNLVPVAFRFNVFQRLEYLLHIPISQMTKDNHPYRDIVVYMRKHLLQALGNQYLTNKNKAYTILFAIAPRTLRIVHKRIKHID